MRGALSGLTVRGRCFVAGGVAALACALALGERDLLRVGIFLLALPLVAATVVARTRYRLTCVRRLRPTRVGAGSKATVTLLVRNVSRMPTGLLLVEDRVPYALGGRPRFALGRLQPRGERELTYQIRSDVRGRFRLGPLSVRLADPFGLVERSRSFSATDDLVVVPHVVSLSAVKLGGGSSGGGDAHARIVAAAGEDDVATREYRHGDDLRRVHWRSTAHHGELMVRREEQYWQSRAALLLDTRSVAHRGDGPGSSFEWAVSAAASIGVHLARRRFDVSFATDSGQVVTGLAGTGVSSFEAPFLDALAVLGPSRNRSLGDVGAPGGGGHDRNLLVAVLGTLEAGEAEHLARAAGSGLVRIALLVDSASWTTLSPAGRERADSEFETSIRLLYRAGWRVLPVRSGDRLDTLWPMTRGHAPVRPRAADHATQRVGNGSP